MKATELRIGNWYSAFFSDPDNEGYTDVLLTEEVLRDYLNDNSPTDLEYFKGIPLTEEWLKRFGFEIKMGAWGKSAEIRIGRARYVLYQNSDVWSINPIDGFRVDFKYIHTVQNHYFAITGEELNQNKEDESEVAVKCHECMETARQVELDTFGGLCEECSGAFD